MGNKNRVITFSGPDGSGKTTVFLESIKVLEGRGDKLLVLRQYQLGSAILQGLIKNIKGEKKSLTSDVGRLGYSDKKRDRDTGSFSWRLRRLIGLLAGIIDINLIGRPYVLIKRLQGYIILVEQAPLDVFVKRHRPQYEFVENVFAKYFPKPNVIILCVADPRAINNRKPELEKNEITDYYIRINKLYKKSNKFNKIDLKTDQSLNQTIDDLKKIIL